MQVPQIPVLHLTQAKKLKVLNSVKLLAFFSNYFSFPLYVLVLLSLQMSIMG